MAAFVDFVFAELGGGAVFLSCVGGGRANAGGSAGVGVGVGVCLFPLTALMTATAAAVPMPMPVPNFLHLLPAALQNSSADSTRRSYDFATITTPTITARVLSSTYDYMSFDSVMNCAGNLGECYTLGRLRVLRTALGLVMAVLRGWAS